MRIGLRLVNCSKSCSIFSDNNSLINASHETCFINDGKSEVRSVHHIASLPLKPAFKLQVT